MHINNKHKNCVLISLVLFLSNFFVLAQEKDIDSIVVDTLINNKILIRNKSIYGLSLKLRTKSAKCSGAWDKLTTVLKAMAAPTKSKTTDDTNAALAPGDFDGDGFDRMIDCDDRNPDLQRLDVDGDGLSTCDGDCNDFDPTVLVTDFDGDGYSCLLDCNDFNELLNEKKDNRSL